MEKTQPNQRLGLRLIDIAVRCSVDQPTHVAYADESYYTKHRYRSIAVVTLGADRRQVVTRLFANLLRRASLKEFKWSKLRQARERFAALQMVDRVVELSLHGRLRLDVLIWDTRDSRHQIRGRDDIANLQRMYYQLFKNVLQRRWPPESSWKLYPDQNSALDWIAVQDYLDTAGLAITLEGNFLDEGGFRIRLAHDFRILEICEVCSADEPICQVADLFAGLGAYSHSAYAKYECWLRNESGQMALELDLEGDSTEFDLSGSDRERCAVMKHLDSCCKRHKLHVGLKSSRGFRTYNPEFPINFWPYEPQHPEDKAPVKLGHSE